MSQDTLVSRGREIKGREGVGEKAHERGGGVKREMPICSRIKGGKGTNKGKRQTSFFGNHHLCGKFSPKKVLARVGYSLIKHTIPTSLLSKVDKSNHRHVQASAKSGDHPNQSTSSGREDTTNPCNHSSMGVRSPNSLAKQLKGEREQSY